MDKKDLFQEKGATVEHLEDTRSRSPSSIPAVDEVAALLRDPDALAASYGPGGMKAIMRSRVVVLCAAMASFGGLTFGYDQGVISVTLVMDHFLKTVPEIADGNAGSGFNKGLLTAILELGAMIGAMQTGLLADRFSRKKTLMIGCIWFVIGSVIQTATYTYAQLVVGRFLGGVGIGLLSCTAPLYISEVAPPNVRGAVLVLEELMIVLGVIFAYWLTFGTRYVDSELSWRLPFGLQILPGIILFFGMMFVPHSPRWLAMRRRDEEALVALSKLRQLPPTDVRVQAEHLSVLAEVKVNQETQRIRHPSLQSGGMLHLIKLEAASWADTFRSGCIKRTHIGLGTTFFQQFIGINALIYYSPTLFGSLGLDLDMSLLMSGIMNTLQLVGCLPTTLLLDKLGRRALMLWGSLICLICHLIVAALIGAYGNDWPNHEAQGWAGIAFVFVFMLAFGGTWGPVGWALPAELFPSSLRAKGVAVSTTCLWFSNFLVGLITPPLNDAAQYGAFTFYAIFTFLSLVWTFVFVPETKGRSLEDMDRIFHDSTGHQDAERRSAILSSLLYGGDSKPVRTDGHLSIL